MPTSSAAVSSLAVAVIGLGAVPAFAQGPAVAAVGDRQDAARPAVALPSPPPGPIESRLLTIPLRADGQPISEAAPPPLFAGALPVITVIDRRKSKGNSAAPGTGTETGLVITINPAPFGRPAPEPDDRIEALYTRIRALDGLDRALVLLYLEDRSYAEIADVLGISEANVATKLSRLRTRLREQLTGAAS